MPYAHGPSVRRLSKIATLLLAKNYIIMLQQSVDELKRLVADKCPESSSSSPRSPSPRLPLQPPSRRRQSAEDDDDVKSVIPAKKLLQPRRRVASSRVSAQTSPTSQVDLVDSTDANQHHLTALLQPVEQLLRHQNYHHRAAVNAAQHGVMTSMFPLQLSMTSPFVTSPAMTTHLSKLYGSPQHPLVLGGSALAAATGAHQPEAVTGGGNFFSPWTGFRQAGSIVR